jgi:hypothetical protein
MSHDSLYHQLVKKIQGARSQATLDGLQAQIAAMSAQDQQDLNGMILMKAGTLRAAARAATTETPAKSAGSTRRTSRSASSRPASKRPNSGKARTK